MDPARTIRAARRARKVSQRELAVLAGVPRSTVERAEAGRVTPGVGTTSRLLAALGYTLVAADRNGRTLELDDEHDRLRDAAGRRFPAHLRWGRTRDYFDRFGDGLGWCGWHRVSWPFGVGQTPPEHTFMHRPRDHEVPTGDWDEKVISPSRGTNGTIRA